MMGTALRSSRLQVLCPAGPGNSTCKVRHRRGQSAGTVPLLEARVAVGAATAQASAPLLMPFRRSSLAAATLPEFVPVCQDVSAFSDSDGRLGVDQVRVVRVDSQDCGEFYASHDLCQPSPHLAPQVLHTAICIPCTPSYVPTEHASSSVARHRVANVHAKPLQAHES